MIKDALTTPLLLGGAPGINVSGSAEQNATTNQWWVSMNRKTTPLTYKDQLNKNWLQKWLYHGRFPFKFVVHLLLVVACTWMVYIVGGNQATNANRVSDAWCRILLVDNCDQEDIVPKPFYLYSTLDIVDVVQIAVTNFEAHPHTGIGRITPHQVQLEVDSYLNCESRYDVKASRVDDSTIQTIYNMSSDELGPLNTTEKELHYFFECLDTMMLKFYVSSVQLSIDSRPIEYMWIVKISFDSEDNTGRIEVSYDTDRYPFIKDTPAQYVAQTRVILNIVIIFLGTVSQVLHWLSIIRSIRIFLKVKRKMQSRTSKKLAITWSALPFSTKRRFFNMWFILAILGSCFNIVGAFIDIFYVWEQNIVSDTLTQSLTGTGTLLAWLCMTHYLEFNRQYTVLIDALVTGIPDVIRFVVGVLPVYIGFALFGFIVFAESTKRFTSFGEAFVTLFGIQNGDDMQASFRSLDAHIVISRIYLFLFSLISIYTIANIFIAIMATAYQSSAKLRRGSPVTTEEEKEKEIWESIMGMNTDSEGSDEEDASPLQPADGAGAGTGGSVDSDNDSDVDITNIGAPSSKRRGTKTRRNTSSRSARSINSTRSYIDSDEDDSMISPP